MRANDRLFWRVAPLGVADITMAVSYRHDAGQPALACPVVSLDGRMDGTIARGAMRGWGRHTAAAHTHVPIRQGDHYFVAKLHRQVADILRDVCDSLLLAPAPAVGRPLPGQALLRGARALYNLKEDVADRVVPGLEPVPHWKRGLALILLGVLLLLALLARRGAVVDL